MKKYISFLFFVSALIIAFAGCTKNSGSSPLVYVIAGASDVTVAQNEDTSFTVSLAVGYQSGTQETVTLTPGTLPSGVTVTPGTTSGTGTFVASFTFHAKIGTTGTYPISIVSSASSTTNKTTSFNLIVTAPGGSTGTGFSYTVNGITSITIPQYADTTITLPLSIALGGGTQETVTLTPATPPTGVTITPATQSGIPSFATTFSMHVAISTPGTYPVTIHSSSASTTTKTYTFNIIVAAASTNCATAVAGTYTAVDDCSPVAGSPNPYPCVVTAVAGSGTQVSIPIYFIGLTGDLNCSAGTMTTEGHVYGDFTILAGTGTFTSNKIIVNYSLTNGVTTTCTTTLTR